MYDLSTLKQPCCTQDEGRPLAIALQEEVANHLTLRGSRARVVSGAETARQDGVRYGSRRRAQANPCGGVESVGTTSKLGAVVPPGSAQRHPAYWRGGVRHKEGVPVIQAGVWNMGTCRPEVPGEPHVAAPEAGESRGRAQGRQTPSEGRSPWNGGGAQGVYWSAFVLVNQRGEAPVPTAKPFLISTRRVWNASQRVKANPGAAGGDEESLADFEGKRTHNL